MKIKSVGVVGCGQMGGGITQVCAQAGYPVTVSEINSELLNKGLAAINSRLGRAHILCQVKIFSPCSYH